MHVISYQMLKRAQHSIAFCFFQTPSPQKPGSPPCFSTVAQVLRAGAGGITTCMLSPGIDPILIWQARPVPPLNDQETAYFCSRKLSGSANLASLPFEELATWDVVQKDLQGAEAISARNRNESAANSLGHSRGCRNDAVNSSICYSISALF